MKKKNNACWTYQDVQVLISICGEEAITKELKSNI